MIIYRKMTLQDVDQVYDIEKEIFPNPWSKQAFINEMKLNKKALYIVAQKDKTICGYAGLWKIDDEGHITNIAVRKKMQGKGIGSSLTHSLIEEGKKLRINAFTLEVRMSNTKAIRMYEKMGFEKAGVRKNYYIRPREDALIMWLRI